MEEASKSGVMIGKLPLISVITPVYNGAEYLDELIQSVLQQDYPHIEHIVIDDGSTDNGATVAILEKYSHLRWWSRENKGQYATLNEGLATATGEVLGIISADDKYVTPGTFSSVMAFWQSHPDCGGVYGQTLRMDGQGNLLALDPTLKQPPYSAWYLRYSLLIPHCSLFVARTLVQDKHIYFDARFRYVGDWDWIIRLSQASSLAYLPQPLSLYREHPEQATQLAAQLNWTKEIRVVLKRYHANYALYRFLIHERRMRKAFWVLRQGGWQNLWAAMRHWLRRK
jgi:glycosyltransferase involved in cell wall biosynthesis